MALNSSRCKLKMVDTLSIWPHKRQQGATSPLCLNTPKMQSCSLQVISDQICLFRDAVWAYTSVTLHTFSSGWAALTSSGRWKTQEGWKCETRSVITSRNKWLQEYPKRGPLTMHHHGLNGNASQHQATAHTLTYGGSSTTNFHHLLQFQWEWEGPRQRVMDRSFGAWTEQWEWGLYWSITWSIIQFLSFDLFSNSKSITVVDTCINQSQFISIFVTTVLSYVRKMLIGLKRTIFCKGTYLRVKYYT